MMNKNCLIKAAFIIMMIAWSKSITLCPAGEYSEYIFPVSFCHTCPSGYRCPGDDGKYQCSAGRYSSSGQSGCSICSAGKYSSAGSSSCSICAAGTFSNSGSGSCTDCNAGYYSGQEAGVCSPCIAGTYSSSKASQCITCVDGNISPAVASTCTLCSDGKTSDSNHQNCINCSTGNYGIAGLCYQCSLGKYQDTEGQTTCKSCDPGSFTDANGSVICTQCAVNTYAPSSDSTSCIDCSFGMFSGTGASSCYSVCGDGKKVSNEECDDNNLTDGDGCDSSCKIEPGYYCKETPSTSPSFCYTICGDSRRAGLFAYFILLGTEKCDDGNLNNLDGCSSSCTVEAFYECLGGTPTTVDVCGDICGDGVVVKRTQNNCDDGNLQSGDGCSNLCVVEYGWDCSGGNTLLPDYCSTLCGDGILVTPYEQCDDGNRASGDGCSVFCIIEENCYCTTNLSAPINSICSEYCGDGKNMYILPCDDGNTKNDDGCSSSCVVETGFKCEGGSPTKKDTCTEKCGDGINLGFNECDDGNTQDGDGCSTTCEIEKCYECKGGTLSTLDSCSKLLITPSIKSISASNTIDISFNHVMNKTDITLNDLSISISYYYKILFTWTAYYSDNQTLTININSQTVLTGKELITIKFINYKVWRGPNGGCLTTNQLSVTAQNLLVDFEAISNTMSGFTMYTSFLGIFVTVILVFIGGESLEMIWALFNTFQLISYLPLMTPYFPEPVRIMFQVLKFTNMNFDIFASIFNSVVSVSLFSSDQYSNQFTENGIETPLFLVNCASVLLTLIGNVSLLLFLIMVNKIICCSKIKPYMSACISLFFFNNFLRFLAEGYLEIFFGSLLNVFSLRITNNADLVSFLISCIFLFILILLPFMSAALLYDKRKEIAEENSIYLKRYGTLYEEFKCDHAWYCIQFYPIFLLRRMVFASVLIILEGYPEIQCSIFIFLCVMIMMYVVYAKPYKRRIYNLLIILNEISLFMTAIVQVVFYTNIKTYIVIIITGWIMVILCMFNMFVNHTICILYNIRSRILKYLQKRTKTIFNSNKIVLNSRYKSPINVNTRSGRSNLSVFTRRGLSPALNSAISSSVNREYIEDKYKMPDEEKKKSVYSYRCPGDDDRHQCNAGQYSSSGQSSCSTCGAGTYSSAGASHCTTCVDGKISSAGASSCTLCSSGKTNDVNHQNCVDCSSGYYGLSGLCYQCSSGSYQNNQGQTSCISCAPGSYSSSNGNAVCSLCNQDYYAPSSGKINCTPCSFGMFSNVGASSCYSVCGDGKKVSDEECDDNNLTDGDGCDSLCKIEPGYFCKETPFTSPSFCYTICGDSKRAGLLTYFILLGTEKCDDGNLNNLDGCSSSCTVETFYECLGGTPTTVDVCRDICGNGVVIKRTQNNCDDGNLQSGDGCSNQCVVESGWDCSGGNTVSPDSCLTICGDGILITPYEQCDDGNLNNLDGCSSSCMIEAGFQCNKGDSLNVSTCSTICGDGLRKGSEKCDDGNLQDNDGCSSRCIIESGFECNSHNSENKDTCTIKREVTTQEAAASTLTQILVGISATISFSTSLLNMSSPIGIFSMINQFQLLLLLLLCGVYISDGLYNLIVGMKFSLINFEFIHIEEIYIFKNIYSYLSFDQPNENLKNIGIESGSTIINLFKLLFTILMIALIHLVFLLFFYCCRKLERSNKCYCIGYKLFTIFTFSIYIRIILQSFLTILISSFNETYQHNANHRIEFVSFLVNILILFLILIFIGLCILQIKKAHPILNTSKQYYLIEFFNGLKNKTSSRMFPLVQ